MLVALIILLTIIGLLTLNYFVDLICFVRNRVQRFHIGGLSGKDWESKVESRAVKWLKHTPTVKITDNSRYVILDMINGKYRSNAIQSWQNASLVLGLSEYSDNRKKEIKHYIESIIDNSGNWKKKINNIDICMLAFSVLREFENKEFIKPAMDYAISVVKNNLSNDNYISYTGGKNAKRFYVDTIGLVCPFLILYANVYNKQEYEELAYRQIEMYHKYAMFGKTELPNHAIEIANKIPLGVYGWGRGVAWYLLGLIDSYDFAKDYHIKKTIKQILFSALESYKTFQRSDGGFGHILQLDFGYDSSSTAAMAWAFSRGYKIFDNSDYRDISKRCIEKLKSVTRINGAIDWCQGDTKDIGVFAQTYDIMPFAQGMTLRAIAGLRER